MAITTNAVDNLASFPRDALMEQERKSLAQAGLDCSELDLRDYYTAPETLRETVAEVDLGLGNRRELVRVARRAQVQWA